MSRIERLATGVVRAWTRAYTAGAFPGIRDARRAEIESDLWEHARAGTDAGAAPRAIAGQIVARCLLGIGADLSWRAEMALGSSRAERGGVPMSKILRRNWWIPAPIVLIVFGAYAQLIHVVGDGFESAWERTHAGWDPSLLERTASVAAIGILLVALPAWGLIIRRRHAGWTLIMLAPLVLLSLPILMWSDPGALIVFPILGMITLVGAVANLAQASLRDDPASRAAPADMQVP